MSPEEQAKIKADIGIECSLEMHGCIKADEGELLRKFIIFNKPEFIVESGSGVSTFYMLKALQEIGSGSLISVDKYVFDEKLEHQDGDFSKRKEWLIPIVIKHFIDVNWQFIDNVDSVEYLKETPNIPISFFFHDSYHSIDHIDKELELIKDRAKWYGAHNTSLLIRGSHFHNIKFKRIWRLIGMENQLAIWVKHNG